MRIAELKQRENFHSLFLASIEQLFKSLEPDLALCEEPQLAFQQWYYHPFYGVFVQREFSKTGRRFLYDSMRHSPARWRCVAQRIAAQTLHYAPTFEALLRPAFALNGAIKSAKHAMILPGNQRIRFFDFEQMYCRVHRKVGFSENSLKNEIRIRQRLVGRYASILPITSLSPDLAYFDEPLIDFQPLNRYHQKLRTHDLIQRIANELFAIAKNDEQIVQAKQYSENILAKLWIKGDNLDKRWPGLSSQKLRLFWEACAKLASYQGEVHLALTHGDFQEGNILLAKNHHDFAIIDWEDAKIRFALYDALCYVLAARRPKTLCARAKQYLKSSDDAAFLGPWKALYTNKKSALALFLLEDWDWLLDASLREGIKYCPLGLRMRLDLVSGLHDLIS
ncbi:MAG: phosphotransferase [Bradymonadales bacterium]